MLFIISLPESYDPEDQTIRANSQSGREERVEHGIHGTWHGMSLS